MHVARLGRFLENPKIDDRKSRKSRFLSKYFILALHLQTENLAQSLRRRLLFVHIKCVLTVSHGGAKRGPFSHGLWINPCAKPVKSPVNWASVN